MSRAPDPNRMRRLAELIGAGATRAEAAAAVGIAERTARTWMQSSELQRIAAATRADRLEGSMDAVLREALTATRKDGSPDHAIRLKAIELQLRHDLVLDEPAPAIPDGAVWVVPD